MRSLQIKTARVFVPLVEPSRYKGAWGGRGSGKSHFFGEKLIEDCMAEPGDYGEGMRAVCIREVQKDLAQSSKMLIESKLSALRIGDPLMTIRIFCDIGGTGAKADAFTMWVAQFIGKEIRVLDYYEAVGQPLAVHLTWLRSRGYTKERAQIWLPHDGSTQDKVFDVSYESALQDAGYTVTVVPNQGKGAAAARIEAGRRLFPSMWFNEDTTDAGVAALGWYHEKRDEARNIGLGPEHDWASHGADAFGLMCVAYEEPVIQKPFKYPKLNNA